MRDELVDSSYDAGGASSPGQNSVLSDEGFLKFECGVFARPGHNLIEYLARADIKRRSNHRGILKLTIPRVLLELVNYLL